MSYKCKLKYDVRPGDYNSEELKDAGVGGCDGLLIYSIIYPDDGGMSIEIVSIDGRTDKALNANEIFKCWAMTASALKDDETLSKGKRALLKATHEIIRETIAGSKKSQQCH